MEERKELTLDLGEGKLDQGILLFKEEYEKEDKETHKKELYTRCVIQCGKGMNIDVKRVWSLKGKIDVDVNQPVMFQVSTQTYQDKTYERIFNVRKPFKLY